MSSRFRPWTALLDALGPADAIQDLIDAARDPLPRVRQRAKVQLTQRLVVNGNWISAGPKAAEILLADALSSDTPEPHLHLDLLRAMVCANRDPAPQPTEIATELREVLTHRVEDLRALDAPTPSMRLAVIQLLDAIDAPLPEGADPDPIANAALAIARGRRGLAVEGGPHAHALASLWGELDTPGLIASLAGPPALFPVNTEPARWIAHVLRDQPELGAGLFAQTCATHPMHPDLEIWARQVGQLAFPHGLETPATGAELSLLQQCLETALPRDALGISGLPPRRADARRWLGLDPPGLLEHITERGPVWQVLEGQTDDLETWTALPLSTEQVLTLAGQTLALPYWLEPVPPEILEVLAGRVPSPERWAEAFLHNLSGQRDGTGPDRWLEHEAPVHANVALRCLSSAGRSIANYAALLSFADAPERTAQLLSALPEQRHMLVLAYLQNPDRPDFQEPETLGRVLPHLGPGHPEMVEAVLRCIEAVLSMFHHPVGLQEVLRDSVRWAERSDRARIIEWRASLLGEERERLSAAEAR